MCLIKIQSPNLGAFLQDVETSGQLSGFSLGGIQPLAVRWEGETRIIERADVSELSILVGRQPAYPTSARIVRRAAVAA